MSLNISRKSRGIHVPLCSRAATRIIPFFLVLLCFQTVAFSSPIVGKAPQQVTDRFLPDGDGVRAEVWAEGLEIPWSLIFLPDGRALVSERPGKIRMIKNGKLGKNTYADIEVAHVGEGGLLGLAAHPDFAKTLIYMRCIPTEKMGISSTGSSA